MLTSLSKSAWRGVTSAIDFRCSQSVSERAERMMSDVAFRERLSRRVSISSVGGFRVRVDVSFDELCPLPVLMRPVSSASHQQRQMFQLEKTAACWFSVEIHSHNPDSKEQCVKKIGTTFDLWLS